MSQNQKQNQNQGNGVEERVFDFFVTLATVIYKITIEVVQGIFRGSFPYIFSGGATLMLFMLFSRYYDVYVFRYFEMMRWYPRNHTLHEIYFYFWVTSPIWGWGLIQVFFGQRLQNKMKSVSQNIGLKNGIGQTPVPIFDLPNKDGITSTLRLNRVGLSIQEFNKAKPLIEGGMNIYIDEIKEDRNSGTVDIIYSKNPLTAHFELPSVTNYQPLQFMVGTTRAKMVFGSLKETPHLLIAGQTGGGKSTFLRQMCTTLYLNNPSLEMTMIDLKGGLEFQIFEDMPRIKVIPNLNQTVRQLKVLEEILKSRMVQLRTKNCSSIDQLKNVSGQIRHIVVVDEAAEIFLGAYDLGSAELSEARRILSQIARQGRAVGIHLVMATQRPDAKSLDTQVKANLTGILCFPMPNNTSSVTVIDSARASTLLDIPGRALWKNGPSITEIQTPHLSFEDAAIHLKPHQKTQQSKEALHDEKEPSVKDSLEIAL